MIARKESISKRCMVFTVMAMLCFCVARFSHGDGFYINNGKLFDANDCEFVIRGVNHPHTWYPGEVNSIDNIANLGANTVRIVLGSGHQWTANSVADVANVIQRCKANKLICMLEVHDTTGYGDDPNAGSLDQAVDYWCSIAPALQGQEDYVLLNIGNEPIGNSLAGCWELETKNAIQRLRTAGFTHTIVVDGPNWGQDWSHTMHSNAASVFAADPMANTLFSVHMYGSYISSSVISNYLSHYVNNQIPIIIGEFGDSHTDGTTVYNVDEGFIMQYAQTNGIGYLGWSWSGNGSPVQSLDMCLNFDPNQLTYWGQRIFNGTDGISSTSQLACVFDDIIVGDCNGDQVVDLLDVQPFVEIITSGVFLAEADVNEDGVVDLLDVGPFVDLLSQ